MRERDVRNAIADALTASGQFSGVWVTGLPEDYGQGSSELTAAAIEPSATSYTTQWDAQTEGGIDYTATAIVTLLARNGDPQLRDEKAEQLLNFAINAINGKSLAGMTVPGMTKVMGWQWKKPTPPERRIVMKFTYAYIVEGWDAFDVSD